MKYSVKILINNDKFIISHILRFESGRSTFKLKDFNGRVRS